MDRASEEAGQQAVLRVFFEDPFWVGVFERTSQGRVSVSKITFGPEPKDYEVWDFLLRNYSKLCFQSFGGSCGKRNGSKSQKDAAAGVQGTAAAGHRNQIPIGA